MGDWGVFDPDLRGASGSALGEELVRLALEAAKNSQIWENLHLLMDHEAERKKNIEEWSFFQREVCQIL